MGPEVDIISAEGVTKFFGDFRAVSDVSLRVARGEVVCLLGPSGCGKTTLMRIVAGLEAPSAGRVVLNGDDVTEVRPERRNVGMVFQNPVVYPGLTVLENVLLPLRRRLLGGRLASADVRRAEEVIDLVGLSAVRDRAVDRLGTTVQQRASVARQLVRQTDALVFDEPLTNVGVNERVDFEQAIRRVVKAMGRAAIYVTHDQTEAMTLGDRIAVMSDGAILHDAAPGEIYWRPRQEFVGWFIGAPGMNLLRVRECVGQESEAALSSMLRGVSLPAAACSVGVRAESLIVGQPGSEGFTKGVVTRASIGMGGEWHLWVTCGGSEIRVRIAHDLYEYQRDVWLRLDPDALCFFDKDGGLIV